MTIRAAKAPSKFSSLNNAGFEKIMKTLILIICLSDNSLAAQLNQLFHIYLCFTRARIIDHFNAVDKSVF